MLIHRRSLNLGQPSKSHGGLVHKLLDTGGAQILACVSALLISTDASAQVSGVWAKCILVKSDGTNVAVKLASNWPQCERYARQCAENASFTSINWSDSAVLVREPLSICTPNPNMPPIDTGPDTKCIVEVARTTGANQRHRIPQASSQSDCFQRAKTCAQELSGRSPLQTWWVPGGVSGPQSECSPWN